MHKTAPDEFLRVLVNRSFRREVPFLGHEGLNLLRLDARLTHPFLQCLQGFRADRRERLLKDFDSSAAELLFLGMTAGELARIQRTAAAVGQLEGFLADRLATEE